MSDSEQSPGPDEDATVLSSVEDGEPEAGRTGVDTDVEVTDAEVTGVTDAEVTEVTGADAPPVEEPELGSVERDQVEGEPVGDQPAGDQENEPAGDEPAGDDSVADERVGADGDAASEPRSESRRAARVKQLEREGEIAADFLETLLDITDLDGDLDVDVEGDRAIVAIVDSEEGRVPRRLVGTDGKVLDALQELTRLAVQAETGERSRLMLDIAGHRAARRAALVNLARTAIGTVKESGRRYELEPMSAFERKVIHDEVSAAGLVSESEGVEPNRYIVIQPE